MRGLRGHPLSDLNIPKGAWNLRANISNKSNYIGGRTKGNSRPHGFFKKSSDGGCPCISYPTEIELQNLVAVMECTSRSLLPAKFRDIDRGEVIRRVNELKAFSRHSE
jgi:hypothetical protein